MSIGMKRVAYIVWFGLLAELARGGIPEPDAVLYGPAAIGGILITQADPVAVIARLTNVPEPVGIYRFGEPPPSNCVGGTPSNDCNQNCIEDACDISCEAPGCSNVVGCGSSKDVHPSASGDGLPDECPGDNYVLRIRLEHVLPGETQSPNAARIGQTANIYLQYKSGPEMFVRSVMISARGMLRNVALYTLDLFAYAEFQPCLGGPESDFSPGSCTDEGFSTADYDQDGDADLKDFFVFQSAFIGQ